MLRAVYVDKKFIELYFSIMIQLLLITENLRNANFTSKMLQKILIDLLMLKEITQNNLYSYTIIMTQPICMDWAAL